MLIPGLEVHIVACAHDISMRQKNIMDSTSITTDQSNRLIQILALMEERLSEVQALNCQINATLQVDEIEVAITSSADLNDQMYINIDTIKRFLHNLNQTAESSSFSTGASSHALNSNANRNNTRLPKLNLPTFCGNFKNWTSFIDLFNSSVESNSTLTNSQKLQYFNSSVESNSTLTNSQKLQYLKVHKQPMPSNVCPLLL